MKKFITFFFFSIIFITNINYSFSIEPDVFVQSTVNRAAETLSSNASIEEKVKILKEIDIYEVPSNYTSFYNEFVHKEKEQENLTKKQNN